MSPKKTALKGVVKKAVEELGEWDEKTELSSGFENIFDVDNFASPRRGGNKAKGDSSS